MESRVKQDLINTIKMFPLTQESLDLLKEMLVKYIKKEKLK